MIKEKKRITAYNYKKPIKIYILEFVRTIAVSLLIAFVFTVGLSLRARHEMIKNIYQAAETQRNIDRQVAEKFIQSNKNLLTDIQNKKYSICMHVGNLYEAVGDYSKAEIAFNSAISKAKPNDYRAHYKLVCVLLEQDKFDEANTIISVVRDKPDKKVIKFKTRSYITLGDKLYSVGKFLTAAKCYEKAEFYYNKFKKKDKVVENSIRARIINSYVKAADAIVAMGYNSDAVRYLKKVEKYDKDNYKIKYKIGIILSDSDPEQALKYFAPLLEKQPQEIDYGVYCTALMKAANIADLEGRTTTAKYYRHKIHTIDLFIKRKVIYKNDLDIEPRAFKVNKVFFTYPLRATYRFSNASNTEISRLFADFVLCLNDEPLETITKTIADKDKRLTVGGFDYNDCSIKFKRKIYTKKELANYRIKIYAYKDDKFKTLAAEFKIPEKSFSLTK